MFSKLMINHPRFSIIIPMYNVAKYIERCLTSVFEQYIGAEQYEIILINDGSPDNSEEIARDFCKNNENVKIITQLNKGLGGARNTGIANASGDFLLFLDSDDWLLPNALQVLNKEFDGEDIVEFSVLVKDDEKILTSIDFENSSSMSGIDYYLGTKTINSACNKLYRRNFLIENNLEFKERIYGEDIQFNSRVFYLAKRIKSINSQLIVFYQSANSITRSGDRAHKIKYLNDLREVIISLYNFKLKYGNNDDASEKYFYNRLASLTINTILFALKSKISSPQISDFVISLKERNIFNLKFAVIERELYRKLFNNKLTFKSILFINTLRK